MVQNLVEKRWLTTKGKLHPLTIGRLAVAKSRSEVITLIKCDSNDGIFTLFSGATSPKNSMRGGVLLARALRAKPLSRFVLRMGKPHEPCGA